MIGRRPTVLPSDLEASILCKDQIFLVCSRNSPWARRRKIDIKEIVSERWALPPLDTFVGTMIADAFRAKGLEAPKASVVSLPIGTHWALVATGKYLGILPASLLRSVGQSLGLVKLAIEFNIEAPPLGIVTLKKRTIGSTARLFAETARDVARNM